MINLEEVTFSYPKATHQSLNGINLNIAAGEFILLAGPSGSGKTSLLKCINGLIPHFSGGIISGHVLVNGIDVVKSGPQILSRHAGYVSQNPENQALLDHVESEIAFPLENAAVSPEEMRIRVEEALDLMSLALMRDRSLHTLSGGERQRVAIASALALRPQILLLDEPTSQLDPQSAEDVLRSLIRLNEDLGLTVILSEHRLERILRHIDRIVFMDKGRILIDDDVRKALLRMPNLPPIVELAGKLGWEPLPLTVKEGRRFTTKTQKIANDPNDNEDQKLKENQKDSIFLNVDSLGFSYNGQPVLDDVSFQLFAGESLVIMGRNGSGKSTLLKCIIGLLKASAGDIQLNGRSTKNREVLDLAKEIAYLPQNPDDLLFADTVSAELAITLQNHGLEDFQRVRQLLSRLDLEGEMASYPRDLSAGQRLRVAMGAVTITAPDVILLDEPTRGLDIKSKRKLVDIWKEWIHQGKGMIIVTHDVELAGLIADRVLIMSQGQVIASGDPAHVLGASPLFAPQIARLFPGFGWLTVTDALANLSS